VQYKENQYVSSTAPIRLNEVYSIGWSGAETEMHVFKMAANFKEKERGSPQWELKPKNPSICHLPEPPYFSSPTTFNFT
jgi:hypothetical protein